MATFLFWNLCKHDLTHDLVTLCHENEVDVLVLAESEGIGKTVFLETVNRGQLTKFFYHPNYSSRLSLFFKYPANWIKNIKVSSRNHRHVATCEISLPTGLKILLVALHLSSKLYRDQYAQTSEAMRIIQVIEQAEKRVGHTNTLVIGDFNMNPFEPGLIGADSFHAVMDQQTAREYSREIDGQDRRFFYNPMWGRMGDTSVGPPGTYYYRGGYLSYFWNTFDQVLLRPDLIDHFFNDQLRVVDKIGRKNLLTTTGRIDKKMASDHLPIMITLTEDNSP